MVMMQVLSYSQDIMSVSQVESLSPSEEASQLDYSNYYAIKVPLVWIAALGGFL